jgi:hypothetical protein
VGRLAVRLFILLIVACVGWLAYQLSDVTSCSGPKAENWADGTIERMDDSINDSDSINDYTRISEIQMIAIRAKSRYITQQNETAPSCMTDLQTNTTNVFYYEWKAYDSIVTGDYDIAYEYLDKYLSAFDAMEKEFYRLAGKYKWDLSD